MKKVLLSLLLFCAAFSFAAEMARLEFPDAKSIESFPIWQKESKVVREYAPDVVPPGSDLKGSVKFTCESGQKHPSTSSPVFPIKNKLYKGNTYKMTLQLMSPQQIKFQVLVMRDCAPWKHYTNTHVTTEPNQWQTVTAEFTASEDILNGVRVPAFFLGNLKPGDILYVASMRFEGPDADKVIMPVFSTTNEPLMKNIDKKRDWSYASAWKQSFGARECISLCGLWDFAPILKADEPMPAVGTEGWAHLLVPAHWRGGNVTNFIHTGDGKVVTAFKGCEVKELRNGWYRRTIDIPQSWQGKQILLQFRRIDMTADIFVNGTRIGGTESLEQPMRSCTLDITDIAKFGALNEITVRVGTPGNLREERSGIAGYVYLHAIPKENFGSPVVTTAINEHKFAVSFRGAKVREDATLKLVIRDYKSNEAVLEKTLPFADNIALDYVTPKLWSPEAPNLYWLELTLERDGEIIDTQRVRFGSAELRVVGPDYLLNGRKINIFADTGLDDGGYWSIDWKSSPEHVRRELRAMKAMNLNAAYFGQNLPQELLDVYDEEGVMALGTAPIPYQTMINLTDEGAIEVFNKKIAGIKNSGRYDNHPSHIGFQIDVWYNFHEGTTNPEYVGLKQNVKEHLAFDKAGKVITRKGSDPNLLGERGLRKARLDKIAVLFSRAFPGKVLFTGGSGEVGDVYATHAYHTWGAPFEEMRAYFRRYALDRQLPIFIGETYIPYCGSLYEIFNFGAAGANPLAAENFARYSGNDGYRWRIFYNRRAIHGMGPDSIQDSRTDKDQDGSYHITSDLYCMLTNLALNTMVPGWRISHANGVGFFCYVLGGHSTLAGRSTPRYNAVPDALSAPTYHGEYLPGGANPNLVPFGTLPFFLKPTLIAPVFRRVTAPLFAEFIEESEDEYGIDHAWYGGETIRKRLLVVNDGPETLSLKCVVSLRGEGNASLASHTSVITLKPGERTQIPLALKAPQVAGRINARLHAVVTAGTQRAVASLPVELFPRIAMPQPTKPLYVCDPEGQVKSFLKSQDIAFTELKDLGKLPQNGLLIVGRRTFALTATVPDFNTLAERGLNTLILAQAQNASTELMKVRTRHAFINAFGHPALRGFEDRDFANWRGNVSLDDAYGVTNVGGNGWSAAGNRNMVASYVFRRPSHGNYLSLLVSGFDNYQTPLLEYRTANGSWIGSQLEIAPRLGVDPVATTLFARLVSYLDSCGFAEGKTLFYGSKEGKKLLDTLGVEYTRIKQLDTATLASARTLLISAPDFQALKYASMDLLDYVHQGGRIIYLQSGDAFESVWLPFPTKLGKAKARQALANVVSADNYWRCGYDNNDLYWHDEFEVPVFEGLPEHIRAFDPAVLADFPVGDGSITLLALTPEDFKDSYATGKTCRLICALLTDAGVKINNASTAYLPKDGQNDAQLDLAEMAWRFALDPQNVGLKEKVDQGEKGSLKWMTGLIADGREVKLGITFETFLQQQYDGDVWYRLEFELPKAMENCEILYLSFGGIDDFDWCYINGNLVGETTDKNSVNYWSTPRVYGFSGKVVKPGKNVLVVHVRDLRGGGGIYQLPALLSNRPCGSGTSRGWQTPYENATKRDYEYAPDPVRQY
jgi:hypothetical protein